MRACNMYMYVCIYKMSLGIIEKNLIPIGNIAGNEKMDTNHFGEINTKNLEV